MRKPSARYIAAAPSPTAVPHENMFAELAGDPARHEIAEAGISAARLGFDLTDPGVRTVIIAAGRRKWAEAGKPAREFVDGWTAPEHHEKVVYYFRLGDLVKIGTTRNIRARYEALRPQGIDAIEFGGRELETRRHTQFIDDHLHAEWFRRSPALNAHIIDCFTAFYAQTGRSCAAWLREHVPALA